MILQDHGWLTRQPVTAGVIKRHLQKKITCERVVGPWSLVVLCETGSSSKQDLLTAGAEAVISNMM